MVVLNRIYTRTGDDGTTALGSGARRKKYDLRVDAYGTLDEVNAVIGIVRLYVGEEPALDSMLARIQNDLFDVEADLCLSETGPARAVCRRAERIMVELNDKAGEGVTPAALKYVNRLSDFLFVAGRHANAKGTSDVLWQPGQNR